MEKNDALGGDGAWGSNGTAKGTLCGWKGSCTAAAAPRVEAREGSVGRGAFGDLNCKSVQVSTFRAPVPPTLRTYT